VPALAVVGNLSRDLVDGGPPRIGGAPFWAARALRVLGAPALVAAKCGDRREMTVEALGDQWTPEDARQVEARWIHVGALSRSDFPPETLAAFGGRVSFDGQGLVRPERTGPLELDSEFDPEVLRHVDVLKLAEDEARVLVGEPDEESLRSLGVPEIVVTLGSRGSLVLANGKLGRVTAQPVTGKVDPTGAGDAFSAAYLVSRAGGHAPAAAARRATGLVAGLLGGRLS